MLKLKLVTHETQEDTLRQILEVYRDMGVALEIERRSVPLHTLIATQDAVEGDKLEVVREKVKAGGLDIPIIVEEHFWDDEYHRYVLDGHCRVRARIELGMHNVQAYVLWSPAGDFKSNFVSIAEVYGNVRVRDLPLV